MAWEKCQDTTMLFLIYQEQEARNMHEPASWDRMCNVNRQQERLDFFIPVGILLFVRDKGASAREGEVLTSKFELTFKEGELVLQMILAN